MREIDRGICPGWEVIRGGDIVHSPIVLRSNLWQAIHNLLPTASEATALWRGCRNVQISNLCYLPRPGNRARDIIVLPFLCLFFCYAVCYVCYHCSVTGKRSNLTS